MTQISVARRSHPERRIACSESTISTSCGESKPCHDSRNTKIPRTRHHLSYVNIASLARIDFLEESHPTQVTRTREKVVRKRERHKRSRATRGTRARAKARGVSCHAAAAATYEKYNLYVRTLARGLGRRRGRTRGEKREFALREIDTHQRVRRPRHVSPASPLKWRCDLNATWRGNGGAGRGRGDAKQRRRRRRRRPSGALFSDSQEDRVLPRHWMIPRVGVIFPFPVLSLSHSIRGTGYASEHAQAPAPTSALACARSLLYLSSVCFFRRSTDAPRSCPLPRPPLPLPLLDRGIYNPQQSAAEAVRVRGLS